MPLAGTHESPVLIDPCGPDVAVIERIRQDAGLRCGMGALPSLGEARQNATEEDLAELEREELLAIFNIADNGGPSDRAMARKILDQLGCTVPDSPAELTSGSV